MRARAPVPQQPIECRRVRKFRRGSNAAIFPIEARGDFYPCRIDGRFAGRLARRCTGLESAENIRQLLSLAFDLIRFFPEVLRDARQQLLEGRQAMP